MKVSAKSLSSGSRNNWNLCHGNVYALYEAAAFYGCNVFISNPEYVYFIISIFQSEVFQSSSRYFTSTASLFQYSTSHEKDVVLMQS